MSLIVRPVTGLMSTPGNVFLLDLEPRILTRSTNREGENVFLPNRPDVGAGAERGAIQVKYKYMAL